MKSDFIGVRVDPDIKDALTKKAKQQGIGLSKLIQSIFQNWIKKIKKEDI